MAFDIVLPNGYVVKGVPEDVTPDQVKQMAISKGMATDADFEPTLDSQVAKESAKQGDDAADSGFGDSPLTQWAAQNAHMLATSTTNQWRQPTHEELTQRADATKLALFATGIGALPELGLMATSAAAGGVNTIAGALTNENETAKEAREDFLEGGIGELGGRIAGNGLAWVAPKILTRLPPTAVAYLKGLSPWTEDVIAPSGSYTDGIMSKDTAKEVTPEVEEYHDKAIADAALKRQSFIELQSYFGNPMRDDLELNEKGMSARDAMRYYRDTTGGYVNSTGKSVSDIISDTGKSHLEGKGQLEAIARADNKNLDEKIFALDSGFKVSKAELQDALKSYDKQTRRQVLEAIKAAPEVYLSDLQKLNDELDIDGLIDWNVANSPGADKEVVSDRLRAQLEQGVRDKLSAHAADLVSDLDKDTLRSRADLKIAEQQGDVKKQTAISHHMDVNGKLKSKLEKFIETGKLPPLTDEEQVDLAMYTAQGNTHVGARTAPGLWLRFRQIQSALNAIPGGGGNASWGEIGADVLAATAGYRVNKFVGAANKAAGKIAGKGTRNQSGRVAASIDKRLRKMRKTRK